ncbi:methyltransferase [Longimycelium tulufanense]|uniref:Methyltransferase n=1 Tax=Longimycelium tulufanense TaxID=907463 RepID=A0A8J3FSP2_9PSEU|nr:class I SAM-dependent methyltransferase [Longimycelium tulufanense]GGM37973.1 methyltransferase [Longimycelium tulufanense]
MRTDAVHRVLHAEFEAARERRAGEPPQVLDVGGGSGVWAVPLAAAGCAVTVVDASPNALATLRLRAEEAGVADRVRAVQGDADALAELVPDGGADLVLGHGLLEVVDDAAAAVTALAAAARPGGAVSVLVANRYAAFLARVMAGRLTEARRLLDDPNGRLGGTDPVLRRFDCASLRALLTEAHLDVEVLQGYGVITDLVPGSASETPSAADFLAELELTAATRPPLRDIATRLHALARRR